jgi:hypothetical protein
VSRRAAIAWIVVHAFAGGMWTYFAQAGTPRWIPWVFAVASFLTAAMNGWQFFNAPKAMQPPGGIPS